MLRLPLIWLVLLIGSSVSAQVITSPSQSPAPPTSDTSQTEAQAPAQEPAKKSGKVKRKIDEAIPDCVNLIFYHGCRHSDARQQEANERAQKMLDEAAERCKQLTAALPPSVASKQHTGSAATGNSANESSSKQPQQPAPYCTAEDVVAADHDTDVGDFNFNDKNYRGAEMRYRSALERLPGEPTASLHLARTLEKLDKKPEAIQHYETFLAWSPTGKDAEEARAALQRLQKELAQK